MADQTETKSSIYPGFTIIQGDADSSDSDLVMYFYTTTPNEKDGEPCKITCPVRPGYNEEQEINAYFFSFRCDTCRISKMNGYALMRPNEHITHTLHRFVLEHIQEQASRNATF